MDELSKKKSIWLELKIVVPVVILVLVVSVTSASFVTSNTKKTYMSTAKLQVGGIADVNLGGQGSSRMAGTNVYAELANDLSFKKLVLAAAKNKIKNNMPDFEVSAKTVEDTEMLEVSVETTDPKQAKILTDAASEALTKKSVGIKGLSFKSINSIISTALKPADKELAKLRGHLFDIQGSVDKPMSAKDKVKEGQLNDQLSDRSRQRAAAAAAGNSARAKELDNHLAVLRSRLFAIQNVTKSLDKKQTIKASGIADKITDRENFRRSLTDFLARNALENLFKKSDVLKVIYPAEVPNKPSGPSWPKNIAIALLAGLSTGLIVLSVMDAHRKSTL